MYLNNDDKNGQKVQAATGGIIPAYSQFAKDWTVGIRYDITPWMMARVEYNKVNGTAWLPYQDNLTPQGISNTTQHWDMFGLILSFRF